MKLIFYFIQVTQCLVVQVIELAIELVQSSYLKEEYSSLHVERILVFDRVVDLITIVTHFDVDACLLMQGQRGLLVLHIDGIAKKENDLLVLSE